MLETSPLLPASLCHFITRTLLLLPHTQGSCTPELGSPTDDYWLLPFARELEDVFEVRVVVVAW